MKKTRLISLLMVLTIIMTGCGLDAMPDLTDDESALITEYAAGLLLKYSKNYDYKIVDDVEILVQEEETVEQPEDVESTEPEKATEAESQAQAEETSETEQTQEESSTVDSNAVSTDSDLAQVLGIDEVSIIYDSYEICDSYPKDNSGFSVSASQGKKLLAVHFKLGNSTGGDLSVNLMDYNISATVTVNGVSSSKALNTLLPNDMISYYNNMKSGESDDIVALFEVKDDLIDNLSQISVKISGGGNAVNINIE